LPIPWSRYTERLSFVGLSPGFWRGRASYGFMERADVPMLLREARLDGCDIDLDDVTYFVGRETVVARERGMGLPRFVEEIFAFMQRNSARPTEYFGLPVDQVVEIGREVAV